MSQSQISVLGSPFQDNKELVIGKGVEDGWVLVKRKKGKRNMLLGGSKFCDSSLPFSNNAEDGSGAERSGVTSPEIELQRTHDDGFKGWWERFGNNRPFIFGDLQEYAIERDLLLQGQKLKKVLRMQMMMGLKVGGSALGMTGHSI